MSLRAAVPALSTIVVQGVELSAQLAAGILVARLLGPEALGTWSLALGIVGMAALVLQPGTTDVVLQLASEGVSPGALCRTALHRLPHGMARVVVVIVIAGIATGADHDVAAALVIATMTLVVNAVGAIFGALIVARGRSFEDLPGVLLSRLVYVAGVGGAASLGSLPLALAAGTLSAAALVGSRGLVARSWLGVLAHDPAVDERVGQVARRRGLGIAAGALSARADLVVLHRFASSTELGWYAGGARLVAGALALAQAVALALHPGLVRHRSRGVASAWLRFFAPGAVIVVVLLTIAGLSLSSSILVALCGDGFRDAAAVGDILCVVGAVQVANTFVARALLARDRGAVLAPAQLGLALVGPALQVLLTTSMGARGSALAVLVVELMLLVASVGLAVRHRQPGPHEAVDALKREGRPPPGS